MALSDAEKELLKIAADNAKEARDASIRTETIVAEHTAQLTELFKQGRVHADEITILKTEHSLCRANNNPGNKAERRGNKIAVWALVITSIFGTLSLIVSLVVAALTLHN